MFLFVIPLKAGILFLSFLLLWRYSAVVDSDIVDQAGEETSSIKVLASANVQATVCINQKLRLYVSGNFRIIDI